MSLVDSHQEENSVVQMQAVRIRSFGGPSVLQVEKCALPPVEADEVLLQVAYCGVCRHDLLTRGGAFPNVALPLTLGHQVSGWVAAVGSDVQGLEPGLPVMTMIYAGCGNCAQCRAGNDARCLRGVPKFLGEDVDGGYAEYVAVKAGIVIPVPDRVSLQEAAVMTCTVGTAFHACQTRGRIAAGETILVTGASGGVGLHAVQVAKVLGSRVIGVTSSQARAGAVLRAGADEVIVAPDRRFAKSVKGLNDGVGVDAVVEVVGGPTLTESIHSLAPGGRLVLVGNVLGEEAKIRPAHFILKELTMIGTKSCSKPEMMEVLELVADGALSVDVAEVIPLGLAETVHRRMEKGTVEGRVILEVSKGYRPPVPVKGRG